MTTINIKLEANADGRFAYYPTQILRGSVELNLEHAKKIRAFYIIINGTAKCHWTEQRTRTVGSGKNRRTQSYTVSYDGKEVYLHSKTFLIGHDGADAAEIPAGLLNFTFACELPSGIPESFYGSIGSISYFVEAVLDIPWRFDKEIKTPFTVVRYDNLNSYPELLMPLKLEEIKTFCCLCWKNGPCLITASIPCGGFSPGATIPIKINYDNRSTTNVELTRCNLIRTIVYTSTSPHTKTKQDSNTVVQSVDRGVAKGKSASIECGLTIPSFMNHTNVHFCHVVQVSYCIEIEGVVRGFHSNLKLRFPITVGAIGVGQGNTNLTHTQGYPQQPSPMPTAPAVAFEDLPPTFEEAIGDTKKSETDALLVNPNDSLGWNVPHSSTPSAPPELPEKH